MAIARKSLVWKGGALTERMRAAQIAGINATMADCVKWSKANHPWKNRTTTLEGGIGVVTYAHRDEQGVEGVWGVQDVVYARILELGGTITPKTAKALKIPMPDGTFRFVQSVTIPPYPYLRPSADAHYPQLAANIRVAYERTGGAGG